MTEFLTWEIIIGDQLKVSFCEKPYNAENAKYIPTLVGLELKFVIEKSKAYDWPSGRCDRIDCLILKIIIRARTDTRTHIHIHTQNI